MFIVLCMPTSVVMEVTAFEPLELIFLLSSVHSTVSVLHEPAVIL